MESCHSMTLRRGCSQRAVVTTCTGSNRPSGVYSRRGVPRRSPRGERRRSLGPLRRSATSYSCSATGQVLLQFRQHHTNRTCVPVMIDSGVTTPSVPHNLQRSGSRKRSRLSTTGPLSRSFANVFVITARQKTKPSVSVTPTMLWPKGAARRLSKRMSILARFTDM